MQNCLKTQKGKGLIVHKPKHNAGTRKAHPYYDG